MKLAFLAPKLLGTVEDGVLEFDCPFPACQAAGAHRIRVNISDRLFHERDPRPNDTMIQKNGKVKVWGATGQFPFTLSLMPSIDIVEADKDGNKIRTICWHGFITNGEAK